MTDILAVYDLGEQELAESSRLAEHALFGKRRTEARNRLRPGDCHPAHATTTTTTNQLVVNLVRSVKSSTAIIFVIFSEMFFVFVQIFKQF